MRRRTRTTLLIAGIVLLLLAGLVYLREEAPPEAARLLPESDGILYVDLKPLRTAAHLDAHPVPHDPGYQRFIEATGFVFERDLNEAAFALHRMPDPRGPNGPVAYSEVFVGRFDGKRVAAYLRGISVSSESYAGHLIYSITNEGRTVRVAPLGYDIVAVSNTPTAEQIHSMLDRYRTAALPFAGSSVLAQHYREVPALSLAWGIGKISLPLLENGRPRLLGLRIPVEADTTFIASLRWLGSLRLRVEEIAPDANTAAETAATVRAMIGLFTAAESKASPETAGGDARALLESTEITNKGDRTVLTATVPQGLLERMAAPAQAQPDAAQATGTGMGAAPEQKADQKTGQAAQQAPPAKAGPHRRRSGSPQNPR